LIILLLEAFQRSELWDVCAGDVVLSCPWPLANGNALSMWLY
jgi:hypothetical protein